MTSKNTFTDRLQRLAAPLNNFRDWLETANLAMRTIVLVVMVALPTALGLIYVLTDMNLIALGITATLSYGLCSATVLIDWMDGRGAFHDRTNDLPFRLFVLVGSLVAYVVLRTFVVGW